MRRNKCAGEHEIFTRIDSINRCVGENDKNVSHDGLNFNHNKTKYFVKNILIRKLRFAQVCDFKRFELAYKKNATGFKSASYKFFLNGLSQFINRLLGDFSAVIAFVCLKHCASYSLHLPVPYYSYHV
jgi:hypothetical protein